MHACYKTSTKEIILFYESKSIIDISFLRKSIGKVLPKYMIPNNYKHLKILPRNTNGKIDRLKLKKLLIHEDYFFGEDSFSLLLKIFARVKTYDTSGFMSII